MENNTMSFNQAIKLRLPQKKTKKGQGHYFGLLRAVNNKTYASLH